MCHIYKKKEEVSWEVIISEWFSGMSPCLLIESRNLPMHNKNDVALYGNGGVYWAAKKHGSLTNKLT